MSNQSASNQLFNWDSASNSKQQNEPLSFNFDFDNVKLRQPQFNEPSQSSHEKQNSQYLNQLEEENRALREQVDQYKKYECMYDQEHYNRSQVREEMANLKARLEDAETKNERLFEKLKKKDLEKERLQAEIDFFRAREDDYTQQIMEMNNYIEQLKTALQKAEIANQHLSN